MNEQDTFDTLISSIIKIDITQGYINLDDLVYDYLHQFFIFTEPDPNRDIDYYVDAYKQLDDLAHWILDRTKIRKDLCDFNFHISPDGRLLFITFRGERITL